MIPLLDINILIALADRSHMHHQRVRSWFLSGSRDAWATCPLAENGFVRILGHSSYSGFAGGTEDARDLLQALLAVPGHQFWPDDLSIVDETSFPNLAESKKLTDLYLLALAVSRGGQFATLDKRIDPHPIVGGPAAYFILPE